MVLIFLFWNISFEACNNDCIMPSFFKIIINFYSVFLKRAILLISKTAFCTILVAIKPEFPFKVCNTDLLCLILANSLFSLILIGSLRVNYSVNIETIFHIFLVVISVYLNFKPIKKCI